MRGYQIPTFEEMMAEGARGAYHTRATAKYSEAEQVLVLHTSGSTGLPKPIYITNGWLATLDHQKYQDAPRGRQNTLATYMADDKPLFTMLPFFHTMGIITILKSIFSGPLILPRPGKLPTADMAADILLAKKPWSGLFAPSILEDMSETQKGLDALAQVEYAFFAGAPLAKEAGEKVNAVTRVTSMIGSTEACFISSLINTDRADWQYFEWSPYSGVVMEDAGEGEGLCECVIKPYVNPTYLGVFYTFPGTHEWRTKDLFEPHPTKPGLWRYRGRRDDVLVLSNGEKFNPVTFEKTVEEHALVKGALVVGQSRFQPAMLVEPEWTKAATTADLHQLLDDVWPAVEKANRDAPAHAQVWKNKIAFTKPEKPFNRAAKGSIQRRATVALYAAEIDALYLNEGQGFSEQLGAFSKDFDLDAMKAFLRNAFKLILPSYAAHSEGKAADALDAADIFDLGADSLQVMALASALSSAIKSDRGAGSRDAALVPRDVYAAPTVDKLAKALLAKLHETDAGAAVPEVPREQKMAEMVHKYTETLPATMGQAPAAPMPSSHTFVLTGSTGALGNFILRDLINSAAVAKVYCLNRSDGAEARQAKSFAERGETADFSKVTFLRTDFSLPLFGLPQETYDTLVKEATAFIHNAWAVDFNHTLESYEPTHIAGTRRVVDFSLQSAHRAHIFFVSSVASVGNYPSLRSPSDPPAVPERFFPDDRTPLPQGYGESKHVAGRILAAAAAAGVPANIVRCGQLGGPRGKGVWNRHEWLPSLVHSAKNMGMVPMNLGNQDAVDWVPIDEAGRTVTEIAFARLARHAQLFGPTAAEGESLLDVFHVQNPHPVPWQTLVPVLQAFYAQQNISIQAVPFETWLQALRATPLTKDEVERKPGVKLVDFYAGLQLEGGALPAMQTGRTCEASACLKGLKEVDGKLFETWCGQWGF
ncbi:uncharacterized protein K452DRAFT_291256 [Aplosporella prunicola CBS 121167]|uniref:Carrier domain-containing protein n=1 Tax=Aplosporella prunicola CBS 121167 TaxID=1176127 RepID=A0A6A6B3W8_9PEZI|nr:uncharacterized protein K452DRAFT_291256 [Aplosporella prunicola CBS 121167]KAF2137904.1 hypothetical protein K452DRAFT_291256 [Aplosporella prunicola CBS 121167]